MAPMDELILAEVSVKLYRMAEHGLDGQIMWLLALRMSSSFIDRMTSSRYHRAQGSADQIWEEKPAFYGGRR